MAVTRSNEAVGTALRVIRKSANLTLADVNRIAGVSAPYLSNVENGKVAPSSEWIRMLLLAIGTAILDEEGAA